MGDFILKTCTAAKQTLTESIFFFFWRYQAQRWNTTCLDSWLGFYFLCIFHDKFVAFFKLTFSNFFFFHFSNNLET